jgi:hypothetical protein
MKKHLYVSLIMTLISCKQDISVSDINKINGYWEIEKVILSDGEKKDYKVNETIDYFLIKDNKGFRQKLMPQFDGKFKTNGIKESISIINKNEKFYIYYATNYAKWNEEIIEIKDSVLVLKSDDNSKYYYKKFKPFSLK